VAAPLQQPRRCQADQPCSDHQDGTGQGGWLS
jgi:hypothetical protein